MAPHKSLNRQSRQQAVRQRQSPSLYHHPPQLPAIRNTAAAHGLLTSDSEDGSAYDNLPQHGSNGRPPPLCLATKKQLLQDIEENGGLHVFSLSQLRLSRPKTFDGNKELLRQVQNYIYQLKKLDDTRYLLKLNQYGVLASSRVSHCFSPEPLPTPAQPLPIEFPPTPTLIQEVPTPISEPTFGSPSRLNLNSTPISEPTFASPLRYNLNSVPISEPNFASPSPFNQHSVTMSSNFNSNALALRPGHHDEVEGM